MKTIKTYILLLSIITLLTNCGDPDPTPQPVDETQAVIDGLAKTWTIDAVTLDGSSVASDWNNVQVSFTPNKSFSITGLSTENSLIWPSSGSYSFPDSTKPMSVLRSDGIAIAISDLTESSATLKLTITGRTGGREAGLSGNYSFSFSN